MSKIKTFVTLIVLTLVMAMNASSVMAAKNSLNLGMVLEPTHLDPTAGAAASIDEVVYANIFEGLTRIDKNGAVKPALAKSWTVSEDQKTYPIGKIIKSLAYTAPNLSEVLSES